MLPLLPHPAPHTRNSLTWPLSLTRWFHAKHTLAAFPCLFPKPTKPPLSMAIINSCYCLPFVRLMFVWEPIGFIMSTGEPVGTEVPSASYIVRNSWPTDYSACHLLTRWFLFGLCFDPEDEGDMFPLNVSWYFNGLHDITSGIVSILRRGGRHLLSWVPLKEDFTLCGGTLGTAATTGLLYQPRMIGEGDCGDIGGMNIGRGNRSTWRKPAPAPLCPPQFGALRKRLRLALFKGPNWVGRKQIQFRKRCFPVFRIPDDGQR
jgi:hypothetical protein